MAYSVLSSLKQAVETVEDLLTGAWDVLLSLVGATEDSSLWWKSVFERKIYKGDVGISIRWFHSKKIDVLWELESLVKSLSQEHQGSTEKLKDIAHAAQSSSSFTQPWREPDCNINNYWFTKQASTVDSHGRASHDDPNKEHTRQYEGMRRWTQSMDRVSVSELNQAPRDFNQSSTFNNENAINDGRTSSTFSGKHNIHTEYASQESRHLCELTSFERTASCPALLFNVGSCVSDPDLLFNVGSCVSDNQLFRTRTSSLPSPYISKKKVKCISCLNVDEIPCVDFSRQSSKFINEATRTCGRTDTNVNQFWANKGDSGIVGKDFNSYESDLDKLLVHHNALRFLWEGNFASEMEIQNVSDFHRFFGNGQTTLNERRVLTTVNRCRNKINDDCSTNNCESDCQNSDGEKSCGNNLHIGRREDFCDYDAINTSHDSSKNAQCGPIKMMAGNFLENSIADNRTQMTSFECRDDDDDKLYNQMNWNALTYLNKDPGSTVDQQTPRWRHSSSSSPTSAALISPRKTVSSAAGSSTRSDQHATSGRKNRYGFVRDCCQRLDTQDSRSIPLKKAKQSIDLTKEDLTQATGVSDVCSLKFDVSFKQQERRPYPTIPISRYLGLETVKLPEPPRFGEEDETDDPPQSSLQKLVRTPLNIIQSPMRWLLATFWTDGEERRLDIQKKRITLLTSENASVHKSSVYKSSKMKTSEKLYYLTGFSAYKYYKLLTMIETKYDILRLQAERDYFMRIYKWKQDTLMDVVRIAKDYYSDPTEMNLARWKFLKRNLPKEHQSYTDVRMAVSKIPDYFPFFTAFLTTVQIVTLCVMCQRDGFAEAGVLTLSRVQSNIPTFLGTETIRHLEEPNPWFGPPVNSFVAAGAVLASCMGPLEQLKESTISKGYKIMGERNRHYFGCCEMESLFNRAGTTTQLECTEMSSGLGKWKMGILCSNRPSTQNSIAHVIRPCCIGYHGDCMMTSYEHCVFIKGIFHVECDHCVQVNCLNELCNISSGSHDLTVADDAPWLPGDNTQWQWWRYLTAIPLVYGIIHLLVLIPMQLTMLLPLEMCVGWHRVAILYVSSSIAGEMVGGDLEPLVPHVGSTSGLGGIMGVAIMELFQAWNFLRCPEWEAIKLSALIFLILFLGTFYLISAISFITGLVVGMMVSLIIIPYITYGRRLAHFRCRLVLAGFILIIITLGTVKQLMRLLNNCQACLVLECMPYTAGVCISYYENLHKLNSTMTDQ